MITTAKNTDESIQSLPAKLAMRRLLAAALLLCLNVNAGNTDKVLQPPPLTPDPPASPGSVIALPIQLIPNREVILSSEISTSIESLPYKLGDAFKAGAVLAVLDCKELQAKQDYAVADLAELHARRESADAEFRAAQETHVTKLRLQALGAAGDLEVTLAAAGVDKARAAVRQMDASADKAKANIRQSAAQMLHCQIIAPFAGQVARVRVRERELVAANQAVLEIVDVRTLKVQLFVPANLARKITLGSTIEVRLNADGHVRNARITRINPRLDGASQVLELEAKLLGPTTGLIAGMLGNARLITNAKTSVPARDKGNRLNEQDEASHTTPAAEQMPALKKPSTAIREQMPKQKI
jgi:RND family efflux transporter MFP subunit